MNNAAINIQLFYPHFKIFPRHLQAQNLVLFSFHTCQLDQDTTTSPLDFTVPFLVTVRWTTFYPLHFTFSSMFQCMHIFPRRHPTFSHGLIVINCELVQNASDHHTQCNHFPQFSLLSGLHCPHSMCKMPNCYGIT